MAFTEFYMDAGSGSNLNAGSTSGAAVYTSTSGNWSTVTNIFTPTDGSTPASSVSVGDWISLYLNAASATPYVTQVTAVAAGVNGGITVSTTAKFGTAPVTGTGTVSAKAGGAWADFGMVAAGVALNTGTVAQPTRINIKAGTYANTTTSRTIALAGTTTNPFWWRGYKTTIGDQDSNNLAVAGTDIPSITFTTGGFGPGAHQWYSNIDFTGATTSSGLFNTAATGVFAYRCRFRQTGGSVRCLGMVGAQNGLIGCYVNALSTVNAIAVIANGIYIGNYITGGNVGINGGTATPVYIFANVFDSIQGDAVQFTTGGGMIANNIFYSPTGNGVAWTGTPANQSMLLNNHLEAVNQASKAAINNTSGTASNLLRAVSNSYFNNTANISGQGDTPAIFDLGTLAGSGFTAPGSQDFSATSLLKAIGFPGLFENISAFRGYMDNGAVQRQEPAGGGTTVFSGEF